VSPAPASDLSGMGNILSTALDMDLHTDTSVSAASSAKRRAASPTMGDEVEETPRKRTKLEHDNVCEPTNIMQTQAVVDGQRLAADLAQELECGCCSAVVHRPVTVMPCQHFFCGRYANNYGDPT
jgi:E3 ubiquitin-protein ligase CHFR